MDAIDILVNEHANIKKVIRAIKKDCEGLADGNDADPEFYREVIDFARSYTDKYHHRKEEKRLFSLMGDMDPNIKRGPVMGMLLEHDLGRSYLGELELAVEDYEKGDKSKKAYIIASALSYAVMLEKHIEKEDTTIYMLARRMLDAEAQQKLTEEFQEIERDDVSTKVREKYTEFVNRIHK